MSWACFGSVASLAVCCMLQWGMLDCQTVKKKNCVLYPSLRPELRVKIEYWQIWTTRSYFCFAGAHRDGRSRSRGDHQGTLCLYHRMCREAGRRSLLCRGSKRRRRGHRWHQCESRWWAPSPPPPCPPETQVPHTMGLFMSPLYDTITDSFMPLSRNERRGWFMPLWLQPGVGCLLCCQ